MKPWKKTQKAWTWNEDRVPKGKLKQKIEGITRAKLKEDLRNEVEEYEAGDDFKYPYRTRKKNEVAAAEHRVEWYEQRVKYGDRHGSSWAWYMRQGLRDARRRLKELKNEQESKEKTRK